ncbi:MAG: ATP-binding protein [Actinobacteria bacterium]|nr:ATP-binding protein [Actinomycetota bacterium]
MINDPNPFVYSHPVAPEAIINRDSETQKLLQWAVGGHYVRLYGPRKFGKTSLLGRVLADGAREEGLIPIMVDLYGVLSVTDVTIRIERAYAKQLKGPLRKKVDVFLKSTGLGLSLGAFGISARIQTSPATTPLPALHALLDLPLRLEEGGGFRALIVFDEFQDIDKVEGMDSLVRSHIQYQGDVASYVFSGSEPGMMNKLFEDKGRPLYGSAVPMRLDRLGDSECAAYIIDRFGASGREVGDSLQPLLNAANGHPQRVMHLAHRLWEQVPEGETATFEDWEAALDKAVQELHHEFAASWRGFNTNEQKTLRAIIQGEGSPLRTAVLSQLDVEKNTVFYALQRLGETADVETINRKWLIVDPLFEEWIRRLRRQAG